MVTALSTAPRTSVYIDAFNLYYGSLKGTHYKWLNLQTMCQHLLPGNDIMSIKYFTAKVSARPNDPQIPLRQQMYLRAIQTIPTVEIMLGHYLTQTVKMRLVTPIQDATGHIHKFANVIKTEEKGSDVNLAVALMNDAHLNLFDVAVVVSNDSDLLAPIKIIRASMGKKVGVLNPQQNTSRAIQREVDFYKPIRSGVLQISQFPDNLTDNIGAFHKPLSW
ncbi:NYN domain-containing protein [Sapientia aquatica]|uniref:NYN domain-containing protein n=1 Tax=Sapientia aquatica TaxID=1549640 RepID=A0A4R5VP78_9BURK|nr:NYN domain-containing protein [Sapientia aquatica]TDK59216.1 NYN domain-containing protein [Sapientia aquatica]